MMAHPHRTISPARARRMARRRAFWLIGLALLAALVLWRYGAAPRPPRAPAALPLLGLPPLAATPVRLNCPDNRAAAVFADLSRQVGVPFRVSWRALALDDVTPGTPLAFEATADPIPLSVALKALHSSLAADYTSNPVIISTSVDLDTPGRAVLVAYPVRDLLAVPDPWMTRHDDQVQMLIHTIEQTCQPDCWRDNGGWASIVESHDQLLIRATPNTHYLIQQLLEALRNR